MKALHLALVITVAACSSYAEQAPDGSAPPVVIVDARMPDDASLTHAAPPPLDLGGCEPMGNLPATRTITINTGDPIPPGLINELQDMHAGDRRKSFQRSFYPRFIFNNAGSFSGASNGQPCQISSAATIAFFEICYEPGDNLTGLSIDVFGGGGSTLVMHIDYATAPGSAAVVLATVASFTPAASWNPVVFSVTPQVLASGAYLHVDVTTSAAGLYLGRATATFNR